MGINRAPRREEGELLTPASPTHTHCFDFLDKTPKSRPLHFRWFLDYFVEFLLHSTHNISQIYKILTKQAGEKRSKGPHVPPLHLSPPTPWLSLFFIHAHFLFTRPISTGDDVGPIYLRSWYRIFPIQPPDWLAIKRSQQIRSVAAFNWLEVSVKRSHDLGFSVTLIELFEWEARLYWI